ncbi:MAG: hypothetical protein ABJA98_27845 [Acidobacteriota bacterium]
MRHDDPASRQLTPREERHPNYDYYGKRRFLPMGGSRGTWQWTESPHDGALVGVYLAALGLGLVILVPLALILWVHTHVFRLW